jgi:hypothetical protein
MNKAAYRAARALIRANGYYALRWIPMSQASVMLRLRYQKRDVLADRLTDADVLRLASTNGY